jgi:hypothetical protein
MLDWCGEKRNGIRETGKRGCRNVRVRDHAAVTVAEELLPTAINGFFVIFSRTNRGMIVEARRDFV